MIKHIWTVICRQSTVDAVTNNISVIESLENLQISIKTEDPNYRPGMPVVAQMNYELISLFFRDKLDDDSTIEESIVVLDPEGKKLGEFTNKFSFEENKNRMRNIIKFDKIAVTVSGTYVFQILVKISKQSNKQRQVVAVPVDIAVTVNEKSFS